MDPLTTIKLLKSRRTKIVSTLGPASFGRDCIEKMISAGTGVFRLNLAHGEPEQHRAAIRTIRSIASEKGVPTAVLADLGGAKARTGHFKKGAADLKEGDSVTVTTREVKGSSDLVPTGYRSLPQEVEEGARILLDDGNVELRVESVQGSEIVCTVVQGGRLRDRSGMHLPGLRVSTPPLSEKDRADALFALEEGVDFLGLSFVRRAADLEDLRRIVNASGREVGIIAKIERAEALEELDAILDASDGIVVARGDLGVELEPERVPVIQNQLVDRARSRGRPVIVATQMLESMVENPRPTRAEVADISQAVMRGADALLLSRETSLGRHPVQSVEMMDRVARHSEGYLWVAGAFGSISSQDRRRIPPVPVGEAVARATANLSRDLLCRSILVVSASGHTAVQVSSARPAAPVLAVSTDEATCRRMNLLWGVIPIEATEEDIALPEALARRLVLELGLAREGDHVLMVRGYHQDPARNAPSVTVLSV